MRRLLLVAAGLTLAGCSQIQQLQPVAGDEVTSVRIATIDVLASEDVPVLVAPVCTASAETYDCKGTTTAGEPITSQSVVRAAFGATTDPYGAPAPADISLVVSVGAKKIYDGTVQEVLDRAGRTAP